MRKPTDIRTSGWRKHRFRLQLSTERAAPLGGRERHGPPGEAFVYGTPISTYRLKPLHKAIKEKVTSMDTLSINLFCFFKKGSTELLSDLGNPGPFSEIVIQCLWQVHA